MKYSQLLGKSSKTTGSDLEIKSHRLLVQAGFMRESVAGRYYLLHLGFLVHQNIKNIVRDFMNQAQAIEVVAPTLHPLSLWQETNRDQAAGFELMQTKDRRGVGFALGGTAEEMFVDLIRKFNVSYKDLPINVYQFGLKFRDEARARGGLLRAREFIMKDAYSFSNESDFEKIYEQMAETYTKIFQAVGLETNRIEADGGYIGGEYCHEFVVDSDVGESKYLVDGKGYGAHEDVAVFDKKIDLVKGSEAELELVEAKRGPTMADSVVFHKPVDINQHIKNVVYKTDKGDIVLVCIRGDLDVNEVKVQVNIKANDLTPLTNQEVEQFLNSAPGFISAVNLKPAEGVNLKIVVDDSIVAGVNYISGGNKANFDYININFKRDFKADLYTDVALAASGYRSLSGQKLQQRRGIEVGNIFQLGYHYSSVMKGAEFINESGKPEKYYMGCYGIGIGRTLAAIAEIYADDRGLVWPLAVAPFSVILLALNNKGSDEVNQISKDLYKQLKQAKIDVLFDDRQSISPGEKLANADLIGIPIRLVVSQRSLENNQVEISQRRTGETQLVSPTEAIKTIKDIIASN